MTTSKPAEIAPAASAKHVQDLPAPDLVVPEHSNSEAADRVSATSRAADRLARLRAQVKNAKATEKAALNRQAAIVGRVVIAELGRRSPEFRRMVVALLRREVKRPVDLAEIATLLIEPKS